MELLAEAPKLVALALALAAAVAVTRIGLRSVIARELERREVPAAAALEAVYKPVEYLTIALALLATLYVLYRDALAAALLVLTLAGLAFSAYPILANTMAYYVVVLEHRVRTGDVIELANGVRGRVVRVTPLYTVLRGRGGQLIVVPNKSLLERGFRKVAAGPTYARLVVELSMPRGMENIVSLLADAEGKVKSALQQRRLIQKPQDALVLVSEIEPSRAILEIHVPVSTPDLRPSTLNTIVKLVAEALSPYDPRIRVDLDVVT